MLYYANIKVNKRKKIINKIAPPLGRQSSGEGCTSSHKEARMSLTGQRLGPRPCSLSWEIRKMWVDWSSSE